MSLVDYLPRAPRSCQVDVCNKIEEIVTAGGEAPICVVVDMPTGAGKSHIAYAFAKWAEEYGKRSVISTPNGDLQLQYQQEFRNLVSLWGEKSYRCHTYFQPCSTTRRIKGGNCKDCPHTKTVEAAKTSITLLNPYTLLAYKGAAKKGLPTPDVMIMDEAHTLVDFQLQQTQKARLWKHLHKYPDVQTAADLVAWLDMKLRTDPQPIHRTARNAILNANQEVHLEESWVPYRNHDRLCLDIKPLTSRYAKPVLWDHRRTKHLVLLSATINRKTVHELGLDRFYDVHYVQCDSPIPHAARPIYYLPVADMSMDNRTVALWAQSKAINELLNYHEANGFVHSTYDDARALRSLLTSPRLMWHDRESKSNTLSEFYQFGGGKILVGSGMREGIDLKGARASWQVIPKIPFLNLGDGWTRAKAASDSEWYDAMAVQELLQACGRVCRGPDDYGSTYILDSRFARLFTERNYMFPNWFKDALRWETTS